MRRREPLELPLPPLRTEPRRGRRRYACCCGTRWVAGSRKFSAHCKPRKAAGQITRQGRCRSSGGWQAAPVAAAGHAWRVAGLLANAPAGPVGCCAGLAAARSPGAAPLKAAQVSPAANMAPLPCRARRSNQCVTAKCAEASWGLPAMREPTCRSLSSSTRSSESMKGPGYSRLAVSTPIRQPSCTLEAIWRRLWCGRVCSRSVVALQLLAVLELHWSYSRDTVVPA